MTDRPTRERLEDIRERVNFVERVSPLDFAPELFAEIDALTADYEATERMRQDHALRLEMCGEHVAKLRAERDEARAAVREAHLMVDIETVWKAAEEWAARWDAEEKEPRDG